MRWNLQGAVFIYQAPPRCARRESLPVFGIWMRKNSISGIFQEEGLGEPCEAVPPELQILRKVGLAHYSGITFTITSSI